VHASHWRFFRDFLNDARPALYAEEIDRYIEAWSQPAQPEHGFGDGARGEQLSIAPGKAKRQLPVTCRSSCKASIT
jgi:hypothetical protein